MPTGSDTDGPSNRELMEALKPRRDDPTFGTVLRSAAATVGWTILAIGFLIWAVETSSAGVMGLAVFMAVLGLFQGLLTILALFAWWLSLLGATAVNMESEIRGERRK